MSTAFVKLFDPIVSTLPKNVTFVKFKQLNASLPILVTEAGIVTIVKPEHPLNALAPTLVTDDGIVIVVRLEQPVKALSAILVMVEPIVTLAKLGREHTGSAPA